MAAVVLNRVNLDRLTNPIKWIGKSGEGPCPSLVAPGGAASPFPGRAGAVAAAHFHNSLVCIPSGHESNQSPLRVTQTKHTHTHTHTDKQPR